MASLMAFIIRKFLEQSKQIIFYNLIENLIKLS
jgi:hypothetical protein